jgi:hypothetical protein
MTNMIASTIKIDMGYISLTLYARYFDFVSEQLGVN